MRLLSVVGSIEDWNHWEERDAWWMQGRGGEGRERRGLGGGERAIHIQKERESLTSNRCISACNFARSWSRRRQAVWRSYIIDCSKNRAEGKVDVRM